MEVQQVNAKRMLNVAAVHVEDLKLAGTNAEDSAQNGLARSVRTRERRGIASDELILDGANTSQTIQE
ncbi:hypothetical protein IP87_02870 [beta proteobacterium AAP121]|nr:hypothetical protein IP80_11310 [beta proteobacterium AAP65]KPG00310.1 hypothetical protein IP87_02870 [beta proteobacterium AAP121]